MARALLVVFVVLITGFSPTHPVSPQLTGMPLTVVVPTAEGGVHGLLAARLSTGNSAFPPFPLNRSPISFEDRKVKGGNIVRNPLPALLGSGRNGIG